MCLSKDQKLLSAEPRPFSIEFNGTPEPIPSRTYSADIYTAVKSELTSPDEREQALISARCS